MSGVSQFWRDLPSKMDSKSEASRGTAAKKRADSENERWSTDAKKSFQARSVKPGVRQDAKGEPKGRARLSQARRGWANIVLPNGRLNRGALPWNRLSNPPSTWLPIARELRSLTNRRLKLE